jgi:hypothetical protein
LPTLNRRNLTRVKVDADSRQAAMRKFDSEWKSDVPKTDHANGCLPCLQPLQQTNRESWHIVSDPSNADEFNDRDFTGQSRATPELRGSAGVWREFNEPHALKSLVRQTFDAQTESLRQRRPLGSSYFLCKNSVPLRHVTSKGAAEADSLPCREPAIEPYLAASVEQRGDRNGLMQTGKTIAFAYVSWEVSQRRWTESSAGGWR